MTELQLQRIN